MALQTITPEHRDFRQITIVIPCSRTHFGVDVNEEAIFEDEIRKERLDLDQILITFWEPRSIRPRVRSMQGEGWQNADFRVISLLSGITKRGIADLFEPSCLSRCDRYRSPAVPPLSKDQAWGNILTYQASSVCAGAFSRSFVAFP